MTSPTQLSVNAYASLPSGYLSPEEASELLTLEEELKARLCLRNPHYWLLNGTRTKDEQDKTGDPFKPFPDRPYFKPIINAVLNEPVLFIEKSRTMMMSWLVSGIFAWLMFTRPATTVVFQSEDEDRATNDVEMIKVLWDQSLPRLKERWKPKGGIHPFDQSYDYFELENGSWCRGLSGKANKSRSLHPTCFGLDEAAFMTQGEEIYNVVKAAYPLHLVVWSSANLGWFRDATELAVPVDWPTDYKDYCSA